MRLSVAVALFFPMSAALSQERAPFDFGAAWKQRTTDAKYMYVEGYAAGLGSMNTILVDLRGRYRTPRYAAVVRQMSPKLRAALEAAVTDEINDNKTYPIESGSIADVMTQLYADKANTFIAWEAALHAAVMKLRGSKQSLIDEYLEAARASALNP